MLIDAIVRAYAWLMEIDWKPEAVTAAATVVLALLTFLLAFGTLFLWGATKRMVRGAERTAEGQLRAYVFIDSAHIENMVPNGEPKATITLKNSGQTPAYNFIQRARMGFDHYPLRGPIPPAIDLEIIPARPLGPGAIVHSKPTLGRSLTQHEIDGLKSGKLALYVVGDLSYRDAFGRNRWLEYCLFAGGVIGVGGDLASYHEGNHTSEDHEHAAQTHVQAQEVQRPRGIQTVLQDRARSRRG